MTKIQDKKMMKKSIMVEKISGWGNVFSMKCRRGEMSGRGSIHQESGRSGKCPTGNCSSERYLSKMCRRWNVTRGTARSGNSLTSSFPNLSNFIFYSFQKKQCLFENHVSMFSRKLEKYIHNTDFFL